MKKILTAILSIVYFAGFAQNHLIPAPVSFEATNSFFMVDNQVSFDNRSSDKQVVIYAANFITFMANGGLKLNQKKVDKPDRSNKSIMIDLHKTPMPELGNEGYTLDVTESGVVLMANQASGVFNGLQTLRQLLPKEYDSKNDYKMGIGMINGCKIKDYPRFAWRGLMFDVSRHFFGVDDVKAYIDRMAQYKLNVFHWHLTDDEGWRIEIKSLPKLTEVGAWRVERSGRFGDARPYPKDGEKATYGGFYTQEQIKDVVKYATERNITIVPEIDIPGHSMAALAAYPELSTKKEPKFVNPGSRFAEWFPNNTFKMLIENTLNPMDEKVYDFVNKVMTEVAALFPGKYIHMGGDECYHGYWEEDPMYKSFLTKNKLKDSHELQSYFVKRVEKIISSKGKKMIGWDEILEGGLADGSAVMSWRGMKGGIEAAKMGHDVVMSPTTFAYLDYNQGDASVENSIYASLSLKKTYEFEPIPDGVDPKYVLGGQGNLWTEVIPNLQYAYYMTYPRAFAIAETVWSPKATKNWESFANRTEVHFSRFEVSQTNISKAVYDPIVSVKMDSLNMTVELKNDLANTDIYYTIDNTYPVNFGKKYIGAFIVPDADLSLRTQTYRNGQPVGRLLQITYADLKKRIKK
jgi:hexosaminidase